MKKLSLPPVGATHTSTQFQTWYSLITKVSNYLLGIDVTKAIFIAQDGLSPASNTATLDIRNRIDVLDFDDTTSESIFWIGYLPQGSDVSSGLKVVIHWTATSATSGDVTWEVAFDSMKNVDIDSDSYDTAVSAHSTTNGTSGIVNTTEISITTIDNIASGTPYKFRVARLPANASDTMVGDAELIAVELRSLT